MKKIKENKGFKEKDKRFMTKGGGFWAKKYSDLEFINSKRNEEAGITLIALIVTIIVLLILARSFNFSFNR